MNLTKSDILENAKIKYQVAIDKHISEGQFLWDRYSAMLTFQTLFLVLIGLVNKKEVDFLAGSFLLPFFGLIVCYLWDTMTSRGFQWNHFWIDTARKIENEYLKDECEELNPISRGKEHRNNIIGWPGAELSSRIIIGIMAILYFVILLTNLLSLLPKGSLY